jgi:two-component system response regulator YesN
MADRRDAGRYESLVSRRETFYNDLLDGKQSPSTIMSEAAELGIQLDSQFYMVCVTRPDPKDFDPSIRQSVKEAVVRSAEKAGAVFVKKPAGEYVTIFRGTDENSVEGEAERALTEAMGEAEKLATRLYAGIGSVTEHPHEISRSLGEAETACNYALFTQAASPCLIRNVRGEAPLPGLELSELLGRATELMQCGNMNDAGDYARSLMRSAARGAALHYAYIDILMTASKVLSGLDAKPEEIIPELSFTGDNAFTINTPQELENAVRQICERVIQHRRDHLVNRRRDLAMTAKQFIDQNYADPALSLSKVARTTGVSPTHFSAVFSRELHETFSDYLARVRMTNAMRLLKTTSLSAAEVSEKVGFNDPQYFSRAFKRVAGMSIRTFRNRN